MSKNLYIAATEPRSGKSVIALGVMELLIPHVEHIGFFRPIIKVAPDNPVEDKHINLIRTRFKLPSSYESMYAYTFEEAQELFAQGREEEFFEGILNKYNALASQCDFVLCEGTDFTGVVTHFEFDINAEIANNMGAPVLIVANGHNKGPHDLIRDAQMALESYESNQCTILGIIANRIEQEAVDPLIDHFGKVLTEQQTLYTIPETASLGQPTIKEIATWLEAKVLFGEPKLHRHAHNYIITAMQLRHAVQQIKDGTCLITPGDRADIILSSLISLQSTTFPNLSGLILTDGLTPEQEIQNIIQGISDCPIPVISVKDDCYSTALKLDSLTVRIAPENSKKIATALGTFEANINLDSLRNHIIDTKSTKITPKMFEFQLIQRAKEKKRHIVLPEGMEDRILQASEILTRREVVDITILGDPANIRQRAKTLGLKLDNVNILNPTDSPQFDDYVQTYYEARKHKGLNLDTARDLMDDWSYFGTMMVHKNDAHGMVSGAVNTTQHTIRPSFKLIKTKPGISIVSSVFFMCLADRVLVYGDCAVNPNPSSKDLAEIAVSSADTAKIFGIKPRVALLSYSTGTSGKGAEVEKVRKATEIARELRPKLKLEGPIQYDAAVDPSVARTKMPDSKVAGRANVLIFPDLNTGNNTYKAVQRSAQAVAIGPILQGLNKPVNDLSRGCTVPDIVNTVAITAIQAQNDTKKT